MAALTLPRLSAGVGMHYARGVASAGCITKREPPYFWTIMCGSRGQRPSPSPATLSPRSVRRRMRRLQPSGRLPRAFQCQRQGRRRPPSALLPRSLAPGQLKLMAREAVRMVPRAYLGDAAS